MTKSPHSIRYPLLLPLSFIYGAGIRLRNLLFDSSILKEHSFDVPVISVGNITVGGTGKTPHTEYLVKLLGAKPSIATLSRGYKRKTRDFRIAGPSDSFELIGDEPLQLKQKFRDIIVAVDRKRVNGIRKLIAGYSELQAIILDDAFQHRAVKPGLNILLSDYRRPIHKDGMLPAGLLREPASSAKRADLVIISKCPAHMNLAEQQEIAKNYPLKPHQKLFFTSIVYGQPKLLFQQSASIENNTLKKSDLKNRSVILVTGIANPDPLQRYLSGLGVDVTAMGFPDHHRYTLKDLQKIEQALNSADSTETIVLTTEKDAMRLKGLSVNNRLQKTIYYIPIEIAFLRDDREEFEKTIMNYVTRN